VIRTGLIGVALRLAAPALLAAGVSAQPAPTIEAVVTQVAGQNAYLDAGAAAGLAAGDTLEAFRGDTRAGTLVVVSSLDDRAVVAFAGEPFPLTRGTRLTLVRTAGRRPPAPAATPAAPAPADSVAARPSILDRPGATAAATRAPHSMRIDGRLQLGVNGLRTATDLPGDLPDATRSFATPFAALRVRADGIAPGLTLDVNARSSYRWAEDAAIDRAGDTRIYTLALSGRFGGVDARAGRFVLEHDPFTGAWDGLALRLGSRTRGVGVAAGLQPDYGASVPTTDFPKAALFAHAEGPLGGGARGRVQALAGAISPTGEGLTLRPFAGVRPQVWARGVTLSGEAMADRVPDSTGAWTLSRVSGRASVEAAPGVRVHAFALRRRSYLLFANTQALLPPSTRVGAGASVSLRSGPLPGATLRADVSRAWARDLAATVSVSGGAYVPRIPGVPVGVSLDATSWSRDDGAGARRGLSAGAALTYAVRGGFAQAGYRYGSSPIGAGESLTTQGFDATVQVRLTARLAMTLQATLQSGDVLRSTRLYTSVWYRL